MPEAPINLGTMAVPVISAADMVLTAADTCGFNCDGYIDDDKDPIALLDLIESAMFTWPSDDDFLACIMGTPQGSFIGTPCNSHLQLPTTGKVRIGITLSQLVYCNGTDTKSGTLLITLTAWTEIDSSGFSPTPAEATNQIHLTANRCLIVGDILNWKSEAGSLAALTLNGALYFWIRAPDIPEFGRPYAYQLTGNLSLETNIDGLSPGDFWTDEVDFNTAFLYPLSPQGGWVNDGGVCMGSKVRLGIFAHNATNTTNDDGCRELSGYFIPLGGSWF